MYTHTYRQNTVWCQSQQLSANPAQHIHSISHHITAQHNTAQHSTTQQNTTHNTTQHRTTQHNTAQHSTAQHSTAQHSTTQHSTAQHNTTQHNTTQHNTTNTITVSHQHSTTQSCVPDHIQHHKRPGADGQGLSRLQVSCDIYVSVFLRPLSEPGQCPVTLLMALAWCVGGAAVMTSPLWVGLQ